jgi:hypothetical protein
MRSRRCSGPGGAAVGRHRGVRPTSHLQGTFTLGPTWKEGQAAPRRRPQPFSRILTAWKGNSANFAFTAFYEVQRKQKGS